jgi:hypothetical protein
MCQKKEAPSPDIFTCTTWFDAPAGGKWEAFVRGMESLVEHNPGIVKKMGRWLVINEPREMTSPDWQQRVKDQFPWIQFLQKEESARGQASSMNIILDEIRPCRYWLHWEEAWFCTRSFLDDALKIVFDNKITQLQLTGTPPSHISDWFSERTPGQDALGWARVPSYPEVFKNKRIGDINIAANTQWPVYSLRPSLNVASFYRHLPKFSTMPEMWPLRFEWEFGRNWVLAGGTKAIFIDAPVTRSATHKSTYNV